MRTRRKKDRKEITFPSQFDDWRDVLPSWLKEIEKEYGWKKKRKGKEDAPIEYINIAASFDIESTSWRNEEGEKRACMYIWMSNICGRSFFGRTWYEFYEFIDCIDETLQLDQFHRMIIYIQNLSYEFQFIKDRFTWLDIFALDLRVPVYAVTDSGIEFRCSYILHGSGLAHMGENLTTYKLRKMVGDLDYDLPRHELTPLTEQEMGYCLADVQVVTAYIDECIRYEKNNITKIPLTKTGYPRRLVKQNMLYGKQSWRNRNLIKELTYEKEEFIIQHRGFMGGFTHGNRHYIDKVMRDVPSYDLCSSYPRHMTIPGYPIGKGVKVVPKDMAHFRRMLENFCCTFEVRLLGVREKAGIPDHILSYSKCKNCFGFQLDNGRIVHADQLDTVMNEVDFECFELFYDYDEIEIRTMYRYRRGYLPKAIMETMLQLYYDKTMLKGVPGRELDYARAKADLNSLFGMFCMNPIRDIIEYNEEVGWKKSLPDYEKGIIKYNKSMSRFSFYGWGCYITSLARKTLFNAILELGDDFIYSDTDSVKFRNMDAHRAYFERTNKEIVAQIEDMCSFYHLDPELTRPKGKQLGIWDYEGTYTRFKCLGAKRYMTEEDGKISITVSGLDKKLTAPWMCRTFDDPFEAFTDQLDVPDEATGKLTHTYIDVPFTDVLKDYLGVTHVVQEQSCVHLEAAGYSLSMAKEFLAYINTFLGG